MGKIAKQAKLNFAKLLCLVMIGSAISFCAQAHADVAQYHVRASSRPDATFVWDLKSSNRFIGYFDREVSELQIDSNGDGSPDLAVTEAGGWKIEKSWKWRGQFERIQITRDHAGVRTQGFFYLSRSRKVFQLGRVSQRRLALHFMSDEGVGGEANPNCTVMSNSGKASESMVDFARRLDLKVSAEDPGVQKQIDGSCGENASKLAESMAEIFAEKPSEPARYLVCLQRIEGLGDIVSQLRFDHNKRAKNGTSYVRCEATLPDGKHAAFSESRKQVLFDSAWVAKEVSGGKRTSATFHELFHAFGIEEKTVANLQKCCSEGFNPQREECKEAGAQARSADPNSLAPELQNATSVRDLLIALDKKDVQASKAFIKEFGPSEELTECFKTTVGSKCRGDLLARATKLGTKYLSKSEWDSHELALQAFFEKSKGESFIPDVRRIDDSLQAKTAADITFPESKKEDRDIRFIPGQLDKPKEAKRIAEEQRKSIDVTVAEAKTAMAKVDAHISKNDLRLVAPVQAAPARTNPVAAAPAQAQKAQSAETKVEPIKTSRATLSEESVQARSQRETVPSRQIESAQRPQRSASSGQPTTSDLSDDRSTAQNRVAAGTGPTSGPSVSSAGGKGFETVKIGENQAKVVIPFGVAKVDAGSSGNLQIGAGSGGSINNPAAGKSAAAALASVTGTVESHENTGVTMTSRSVGEAAAVSARANRQHASAGGGSNSTGGSSGGSGGSGGSFGFSGSNGVSRSGVNARAVGDSRSSSADDAQKSSIGPYSPRPANSFSDLANMLREAQDPARLLRERWFVEHLERLHFQIFDGTTGIGSTTPRLRRSLADIIRSSARAPSRRVPAPPPPPPSMGDR